MSITLVIPCRNEITAIEACLRSILTQDAFEKDVEVLVIDGDSDDGTRQLLDRLAAANDRLRILNNPRRIAAAGLNLGILQSRGDPILRLDAHTQYAPDYLRRCLETLEATGADNVGGPWIAVGTTSVSTAIAAALQSPLAIGGARSHDPRYEGLADTVYLGCWPRRTFDRFGLFDETLVRNQDDEHNLRICRGGGRVWQSPRIRSWYQPRSSFPALFRQYRQYGYWKVRVIQKHRLPAAWRHLVPGLFVLILSLLSISTLLRALTPLPLALAPWLLLGVLTLYGSAVLGAALLAARRTDWHLLPILAFVFPCLHFGYGLGFCEGIWTFVVRGRHPSSAPALSSASQVKP